MRQEGGRSDPLAGSQGTPAPPPAVQRLWPAARPAEVRGVRRRHKHGRARRRTPTLARVRQPVYAGCAPENGRAAGAVVARVARLRNEVALHVKEEAVVIVLDPARGASFAAPRSCSCTASSRAVPIDCAFSWLGPWHARPTTHGAQHVILASLALLLLARAQVRHDCGRGQRVERPSCNPHPQLPRGPSGHRDVLFWPPTFKKPS